MAFVCGGAPALRRSRRGTGETPRRVVSVRAGERMGAEPSDPSRRDFLHVAAIAVATAAVTALPPQPLHAAGEAKSLYDLSAVKDKEEVPLDKYRGKVTLVVNVATYCALTRQYEGLVGLYDKYNAKGFELLAFPCNQFGNQEPNSNEEICAFAREKFGAKFIIFDKVNVNPPDVTPVYQYLKASNPDNGGRIEWNFAKFLVDRDGRAVRRYKPGIQADAIESDVAALTANRPLPERKKPSIGVA